MGAGAAACRRARVLMFQDMQWVLENLESRILLSVTNPAGWWKFDDAGGGVAADSSANSNHGIVLGGATWSSDKLGHGRVHLDGTDDRVSVADAAALDFSASLTLVADVRASTRRDQVLISKMLSGVGGYELGLNAAGRIYARFANAGTSLELQSSSLYATDGNADLYVVATYDGATARLYLNGVLDNSAAGSLSVGTQNAAVSIGATAGGAGEFRGSIDEVRLYNYALDSGEVTALLNPRLLNTPPSVNAGNDQIVTLFDPVSLDATVTDDGLPHNQLLTKWTKVSGGGAVSFADPDAIDTAVSFSDVGTYVLRLRAFDGGIAAGDMLVSTSDDITITVQPALNQNLAGSWQFEQGAGTTATDSSVNANHGTLTNGPTWTTGKTGGGLNFDGTNDRVVVLDSASLDITSQITLAAWVKPTRAATTQYIIKKARINSTDGYELSLSNAGLVFVRFNQVTSGITYRLNSTLSYPTDGTTWMHIAATYDGATIKLYLNGALHVSMPAAISIAANNVGLGIGAEDAGQSPYEGVIDDARVYSRALTPGEINALGGPVAGSPTLLNPLQLTQDTADRPQSKLWKHDSKWWGVFPNSGGTWVWRLDGATWTNVLNISASTDARADVKVVGNVVHVLLYAGVNSELASIEYAGGTYQRWSQRMTNTPIALSISGETGTLDIDGTGRMWIISDSGSLVQARWLDGNYSSLNGPIPLFDGIDPDDIAASVAFPNGSIGVMWSNQITERFGFITHAVGADPMVWSADEVPASQSALNIGLGMADDHINLAMASDGTLYAAVKTGYDTAGQPANALLVRRPNGTWDNLYSVDTTGTRPIVVINEADQSLLVIYLRTMQFTDVVYRKSPLSSISFGPIQTLMSGSFNSPTSTKLGSTGDLVVTAVNSSNQMHGVHLSWPVGAGAPDVVLVTGTQPQKPKKAEKQLSLADLESTWTEPTRGKAVKLPRSKTR